MAGVYIGTSGYSYPHWRERFYPKGLSQGKWLEWYAQRFPTVELNVTFYRLPKEDMFRQWHARTPDTFCFTAKGSRFITHVKRLVDVKDSIELFMKRVRLLREKLAVVLWQFPPSFQKDMQRLEEFLKLLQPYRDVCHVVEVRHKSWLEDDFFELLRSKGVTLCLSDWPSCPVQDVSTANVTYIRRHGMAGQRYGGSYTTKQLSDDAGIIQRALKQKHEVYAYFNNDANAYAPHNALELMELVGKNP